MNRVILLGNVRGDVRTLESKSGSISLQVDLETMEEEVDPRSGEPYMRAQIHRLTFSGKLATSMQMLLLPGVELSVEGKLSYWKGSASIRVSQARKVEPQLPEAAPRRQTSDPDADLAFAKAPAFSTTPSRR